MAGLRGNDALLGFERQTAKGTPATLGADADVTPFSGGNIQPSRVIDQLSETDDSRDEGQSFVQQTAAEGSPEFYVRGSIMHHALRAAFGAIATSGVADPWTHDIDLADSLSYWTFYKEVGSTLFERYDDCLVNEITVSAEAGQPLTCALDVMGRSATRLAAAPGSLAAAVSDPVYNYNEASVTLGGGATALVGSFEFTLTNNVSLQQTDDSVPYDVVPGLRSVTLGFDLIFETLDEYNKFHYGGAAGTTQDPNIFTTDAEFLFEKDAGNDEITFTFPSIAYEEFPVEPDPGGDPITVAVRARAQRHASGLVSAQVINDQAT